MTVRERILRQFADGDVTAASPLTAVVAIGPYLETRLRGALHLPNAAVLTVGRFWRATRSRTTDGVTQMLRLALQNERANQCVPTRVQRSHTKVYHVGDVNQYGYEACVTLLNYYRTRVGGIAGGTAARYGALPARLPVRAFGSKACGCRSRARCRDDAACRLSHDGARCVPRAHNATGFVGATSHTNQRESVANRARVRRASRLTTAQVARDPDARRDARRGRSRTLSYDRGGDKLWRRPSARVRAPRRD